jgi:DNA invertase Pin-like site-specific DNA recombinase
MYSGYIRISRMAGRSADDDSFQSADEQARVIQRFADAADIQVAISEPELDVTGSKLARPILDEIMREVLSGRSEGIIVAKVNRLSRAGLGDAIKLVETITGAGATVCFVELGNVDPKSATGELIVSLWLAIARMQYREYTSSWLTSRTNAVNRGAFVGPVPLGLTKANKGGPLQIDKKHGPAMRYAFELSGSDGLDIALEYCRVTWPEKHWTRTALKKIFANRVYLGESRSGEIVARDVIEPLVSEQVWYAAQHITPGKAASLSYQLSGIARCANCGGPMVGHKKWARQKTQVRGYRCTGVGCDRKPHVTADDLEAIVSAGLAGSESRWLGPDEAELRELEQAQQVAREELEAFVVSPMRGDQKIWDIGMQAREATFAAAQVALSTAREAAALMPDVQNPTPEDLRRMIKTLTVENGRKPLADRVKLTLA